MPVAPTSPPPHDCENQECLQILPNVLGVTKELPVENHWLRGTSKLLSMANKAISFLFDILSSCLLWFIMSPCSLSQDHSLLRVSAWGKELSLNGSFLGSLQGWLAPNYPLGSSLRPSLTSLSKTTYLTTLVTPYYIPLFSSLYLSLPDDLV